MSQWRSYTYALACCVRLVLEGASLLRLSDCFVSLCVLSLFVRFVYKLTHETPAKQSALLKAGATIVIQCTAKSEMSLC